MYAAVYFGAFIPGNVFKWNGSSWSQLGSLNANASINTICKGDSGKVYAAGDFTNFSGTSNVAQYNPLTSSWSDLGTLLSFPASWSNPTIATLCSDVNYHVYFAGDFADVTGHCYVGEFGPESLTATEMKVANNEFLIYPNPAKEEITISWSHLIDPGLIPYYVYDVTGRIYIKGLLSSGETQINVSSMPSGIYLLKIGEHEYRLIKN